MLYQRRQEVEGVAEEPAQAAVPEREPGRYTLLTQPLVRRRANGTPGKITRVQLEKLAGRSAGAPLPEVMRGGPERSLGADLSRHERASELDPQSFSEDIRRAKSILDDIGSIPVIGYRAPSFSMTKENATWAFAALSAEGYRYSSSVYPVRHDHSGIPDAPRFSYLAHEGLLEVPPTTVSWMHRNWPASGGGYFRLMPYSLSRRLISRVNNLDGQAAVFYFHPWEIDTEQPRVPGIGMKTRFRHYVNIPRMESRLRTLLSDFKWGRMDKIFLSA